MYPEKLKPQSEKNHWYNSDIFSGRNYKYTEAFMHQNYQIDMHCHDFHEINIIIQGEGRHYIEESSYPAETGDVFVIPPGVRHGYVKNGRFDVFHILIHDYFFEKYRSEIDNITRFSTLFEIEPYLRQLNNSFFLRLDFSQLENLKSDMNFLLELAGSYHDETDIFKNIITFKIICYLCYVMELKMTNTAKDETNRDYPVIVKCLEYIHSNYNEKISIDQLALMSSMSRSTFIRKFKKMCNISPIEYLIHYRVEMAKKMLSFNSMSKTQVAQECGFYDFSHMKKYLLK